MSRDEMVELAGQGDESQNLLFPISPTVTENQDLEPS